MGKGNAQNLWNDPRYVKLLEELWTQPSSVASKGIIKRLAGIREPNSGYDKEAFNIVDVGCGVGRMASLFKHAKYKGYDSSDEMVRICKSRGLNVARASVYDIPEPDRSVDLVICHAVIFHIVGVNEAIRELWRITKGRLIYSLYYVPLFTRVKTPPFIKFQFNHQGAVPTRSEDMGEGLGWWSVQNIVPCWQVTRFVKKYIKPRHSSFHWHTRIEHCTDKIVFCVLDR